eukprot:10721565-Alexandrium_andersonii.AAC.1
MQASVQRSVFQAIARAGPRPAGATPSGALQELLRTHGAYEEAPVSVVPFDPAQLKILRSVADTKPILQ